LSLLRSIESRDFCSKVVVMIKSKQRNTSVLGSKLIPTIPVIPSLLNDGVRWF